MGVLGFIRCNRITGLYVAFSSLHKGCFFLAGRVIRVWEVLQSVGLVRGPDAEDVRGLFQRLLGKRASEMFVDGVGEEFVGTACGRCAGSVPEM